MVFTDYEVSDTCQNLEESYGEVCVQCNKCGRFNEVKKNEILNKDAFELDRDDTYSYKKN